MTTPWSAFFDLLSPDVPGCPQAMQELAVRQAGIAFCEQSLAWTYDHPEIAVIVGTDEYAFIPPVGAVVHAITYAEFNGQEIYSDVRPDNMLIWNWRHQTGTPQYALGGPTSVTLVPTPNVAGPLAMTVALKPSPTATGIDADIFNEYRTGIAHGALAKLMMSPKKPYTSPALAQMHQQQFNIEAATAGIRKYRGFTRAPLQTAIMRRRTWP